MASFSQIYKKKLQDKSRKIENFNFGQKEKELFVGWNEMSFADEEVNTLLKKCFAQA